MRRVLAAQGLQTGMGWAFVVGGVLSVMSSQAFHLTPERKPAAPARHISQRAYLTEIPALLRRDRSFGWFIVSRLTGTIAASAPPFFTVYAMARYGVGREGLADGVAIGRPPAASWSRPMPWGTGRSTFCVWGRRAPVGPWGRRRRSLLPL